MYRAAQITTPHGWPRIALTPTPQVSIPSDLSPEAQYRFGAALAPLRSEGIMIMSGGLTVHTFRDFSAFSPSEAKPIFRDFERSVVQAVTQEDVRSAGPGSDQRVRADLRTCP